MNDTNIAAKTRKLGGSDLSVTPVGLGTWQFSEGRGMAGSFWPALPPDVVDEVVKATLDGGVTWFDTAEVYGWGKSEAALARALANAGKRDGDVVVATKWWPAFRTASSIGATFGERLRNLDGFSVDLHQVHQPLSLSSIDAQMGAMAELVQAGKVRAVGVSNFSARAMTRAHEALAKRGLPLASNQVHYNLLNRKIETNGVMAAAKELGVTIIAYSPLAQGLLTGRFHADPGAVRQLSLQRRMMMRWQGPALERSRPLVDALREIAEARGVTPAQVALNWLLTFHGDTVVAIPGASSARQVEQNVGAMRFELSRDELDRVDGLSRQLR
jgi:aryl-alcohol dehydrogenase-like predicted oxidoreductase